MDYTWFVLFFGSFWSQRSLLGHCWTTGSAPMSLLSMSKTGAHSRSTGRKNSHTGQVERLRLGLRYRRGNRYAYRRSLLLAAVEAVFFFLRVEIDKRARRSALKIRFYWVVWIISKIMFSYFSTVLQPNFDLLARRIWIHVCGVLRAASHLLQGRISLSQVQWDLSAADLTLSMVSAQFKVQLELVFICFPFGTCGARRIWAS